jgi:pyruvate formate lyase activating enzyme
MNRRAFLWTALLASLGLAGGCQAPGNSPASSGQAEGSSLPSTIAAEGHEARYYQRLTHDVVRCQLCWRGCTIAPGEVGFCRNRRNVDGVLYSLVYGRPGALQVDPIEKEPCFHMLPGSSILCTGTAGCNNRCLHCHNWPLSQRSIDEIRSYTYTPAQVAAMAIETTPGEFSASAGPIALAALPCDAVSFTYNEPTVFYEFMFDIAMLARELGLKALFHTNGSIEREPLQEILPVMNAVTVDLKGFTESFYRRVISGELEPVLRTLERIRRADVHLEIVNLVIPTHNDDPDDLRRMCAWIVANLGAEVPLHFTRFFPNYQLDRLTATPVETLETAAEIADAEGLRYVYIGNLPGHRRNSTYCPTCGEELIRRSHFTVSQIRIDEGRCPACGLAIPGIWER